MYTFTDTQNEVDLTYHRYNLYFENKSYENSLNRQ